MGYINTNIKLDEEDYLALKEEAAKRRKSLSAVIGEKIKIKKEKKVYSKVEAEKLMEEIRKHAKENAKYTKGFDSVKVLREMRYGEE